MPNKVLPDKVPLDNDQTNGNQNYSKFKSDMSKSKSKCLFLQQLEANITISKDFKELEQTDNSSIYKVLRNYKVLPLDSKQTN